MNDETKAVEAEPVIEPVVEPVIEPVIEPVLGEDGKPVVEPVLGEDGKPVVEEEMVNMTKAEMDRRFAKVKKNERYRAKREHEAYLRGRNEGTQPVKPAEQKEAEPIRDDYPDYESYLRAVTQYEARTTTSETLEKGKAETAAKTANEATETKVKEFQAKLFEKYPDIEQKLDEAGDLVLPEGVGLAIAESEFGPDIVNHFATNIKEGERISTLTPSAALREIGRLEARFELEVKPPIKPTSAAPEPITPVKGASNANPNAMPSTDKPEEWAAWRNKKLAAKH